MPFVISISGKQGSGKSTLKNTLLKMLPNAKSVRFAASLYECHDYVWKWFAERGMQPETKAGDLLQDLGQFARKRDPDFWVNDCKKRAKELSADYLIIEDTRHVNEFSAFPGALTVRLECDRDVRKSRAESWRDNEHHVSDTGLDNHARHGLFDVYFDSGVQSTQDIAHSILSAIEYKKEQRMFWPEIMYFEEKFYSNPNYTNVWVYTNPNLPALERARELLDELKISTQIKNMR